MLNLEQAAEYMGLAVGEFLELLDGGIGPAHYKIGKVYRFKQADLDRFMEAHRVEESSQNLRTAIGMLATPLDSLREPATEQVEAPPPGPRPTVVLPGDPQPVDGRNPSCTVS